MSEANEDFRRLLQKLGWTNSRAALELGYSPGAITQILDGSTTPRPVALKLLKAAAGELVIGARQQADGLSITPEEREVLAGLRAMNPEVRQAMVAALKAATPKPRYPIESRVPSMGNSVADALQETAEPAPVPPPVVASSSSSSVAMVKGQPPWGPGNQPPRRRRPPPAPKPPPVQKIPWNQVN